MEESFANIASGNGLTFIISVDVKYSKKTYKGDFEVRNPAVKDTIAICLEAAKLRKGVPKEQIDIVGGYVIQGLAALKVLCIKAPEWVQQVDKVYIFDELPADVVAEFYSKYIDNQNSFCEEPKDSSKQLTK